MRRSRRESAMANAIIPNFDNTPLNGKLVTLFSILFQTVAGGADRHAICAHHPHCAIKFATPESNHRYELDGHYYNN